MNIEQANIRLIRHNTYIEEDNMLFNIPNYKINNSTNILKHTMTIIVLIELGIILSRNLL